MTPAPFLAMLDPVSYPGGKGGDGVYQRLINLMPPHDVYIEPFAGGAALMRMKRPAALNIAVDLSRSCIERLQIDLVGSADSASRYQRPPAPDSARLAASADIARNGAAAGIAKNGAADRIARNGERRRRDRTSPDSASGSDIAGNGAGGHRYEFRVSDGIQFLRDYPFAGGELVYCDPPYLRSTRSGGRLYEFEMPDVDHRRLLRVIRDLPAMVMISGYASPMYERALRDWHVTSYQTMTRGGLTTEFLWCNFPPPLELHDYRYLGTNFRERERITRQKKRWVARLEKMAPLQRQALLSAIGECTPQ